MLPANAFAGKAGPPTAEELAAELGSAMPVWERLIQECALDGQEWNSYSRKAGWSLRLKRGERNIVYLSPSHGCFLASFALGDKAVEAARASKLPKAVMQIIDTAKRYAEGTAVRLEVKSPKDIAPVKALVKIKLDH